jgi:hypothetical protein
MLVSRRASDERPERPAPENEPLLFQHRQRLPHRDATDAVANTQFRFRSQSITGAQTLRHDLPQQLLS